jgi:hypothetical protein
MYGKPIKASYLFWPIPGIPLAPIFIIAAEININHLVQREQVMSFKAGAYFPHGKL